jgi:hypothetical protein
MEHAVDRDHGIVGRRGREVDLDVAVRALPRIERRCLIEELLGGVIAVSGVRTSL